MPLFLEELTKTIIESGLLREEDGHYALDGALPPLAIPTTLHDLLMARLDRLAPVREVAQIGAAIGREFSYPLLSAVAQQPDDRLTEALDRLVRAELVFGRGEVPEAVYTFKHALVQEAAYASLLRERRRQLHARIAQALEGAFPEVAETQPELVAHHYAAAGLAAPAIDYYRRAAERAMAASANADAITHLTKGLELIASLAGIVRADLAGDRLPPRARPPAYCHTRVWICRGAGRLHPSQGVVCGRRRHPRALSQPYGVVGLSSVSTRYGDRVGAFPGAFRPRSKARER